MPLNDRQVKNANATEKERKLFDGGGLFLLVKTNGKILAAEVPLWYS